LLPQTRDSTAERLRDHRAIRALKHIATQQAKEVLQTLAEGAPEARRAEEAKVALRRLTRESQGAPSFYDGFGAMKEFRAPGRHEGSRGGYARGSDARGQSGDWAV
jgi:hypothetical protein